MTPSRNKLAGEELPTADEEVRLLRLVRQGDEAARQRMIQGNLRLVVSIANRYQCPGMIKEDLIQEGTIGLIHALQLFDPDKGNRFSTYATYWIRQAISRAISVKGRMVRLPDHINDGVRKMDRCRMKLREQLDREPTNDQLAEEMGVPTGTVEALLQAEATAECLSLDALVTGEEGTTPFGDLVLDLAPGPQHFAIRSVNRTGIEELLKVLNARQRLVIDARFGLTDGQARPLQQIADELGITRQGVAHIQRNALKKLRTAAGEDLFSDAHDR